MRYSLPWNASPPPPSSAPPCSTDNYVVAGALLAIGIVNTCVQNENDPAFALIYDYVNNPDATVSGG